MEGHQNFHIFEFLDVHRNVLQPIEIWSKWENKKIPCGPPSMHRLRMQFGHPFDGFQNWNVSHKQEGHALNVLKTMSS